MLVSFRHQVASCQLLGRHTNARFFSRRCHPDLSKEIKNLRDKITEIVKQNELLPAPRIDMINNCNQQLSYLELKIELLDSKIESLMDTATTIERSLNAIDKSYSSHKNSFLPKMYPDPRLVPDLDRNLRNAKNATDNLKSLLHSL